MKINPFAIVAALLLTLAIQATGLAVMGGYSKVPVPANSDVTVAVTLTQAPVGTFTATGNTGGNSITVSGGLTVNAYQNLYYVVVTSGTAAGRWSTISSNTATNLVLADASFVTNVSNGTTFQIIPHQTLAKVFSPDLLRLSFTASTSSTTHTFEVLLPNPSPGINNAPVDIYYYRGAFTANGSSQPYAWRKSGSTHTYDVYDNTVLSPDSIITVRNLNGTALTFIASGILPAYDRAQTIPVISQQNDVPVNSGSPLALTLRSLNLGGTAAFQSSTSSTTHTDELYVYTNTQTGLNNAPVDIYYYRGAFTANGISQPYAWRKNGAAHTYDSYDDQVLPVGAAMFIRKGTTGSTATWIRISGY